MSELNITQNKVKISRRKTYLSLNKWIDKMNLAFDNALLPTIYPYLLTVGYDEAKINGMKQKLSDLESLCLLQIRARAEKIAATDNHVKNCKEVNRLYSKHRALLKIMLNDNKLAKTALKLNTRKKKDFGNWYQDVSNFYTQLVQNSELAMQAAVVGITVEIATAQLQKLAGLQTITENAKAQQATEARNKAFDELRPIYAEYIKYARILLAGNQALEAIGIVVKRK